MEKRIIEATQKGFLKKSTLKALKTITGDKDNAYRPFLQYVHYNPEFKRLEITNGRVMVLINAAFMADPEREGFFKINGDMLIEEEYIGNFPKCEMCIPQNCNKIAEVEDGFSKKDGAYRVMALALLTRYVFKASEKWMIGTLEVSEEWHTVEWKEDSCNAIILKNSGKNITAVIMPTQSDVTSLFTIKDIQRKEKAAV